MWKVDAQAWTPLGEALRDHAEGDVDAVFTVVWEDGARLAVEASIFFREPADFPDAEAAALALCEGRVLDLGAGAGCHALALQEAGHEVTALDLCPQAVEVMRRRGVRDARQGDLFAFDPAGVRFDTLLLLMNGIGVVGDLAGLDRFLELARGLLREGGQILLDSSDLRASDDPDEPGRITSRLRAGRFRGETVQRIEYRGRRGAPLPWLYLDPKTLAFHARRRGWRSQVVFESGGGDFLARLG